MHLDAISGGWEWLTVYHTLRGVLLMVLGGPPGIVPTFAACCDPVHADRTTRIVSRAIRISVFARALLLLSCADYQTWVPTESPACPLHAEPALDPRPGPPKEYWFTKVD